MDDPRHPVELFDRGCALQLDQLMAVAGLHPADAVVGDQEAHHVALTEVGHEGGPLAVPSIAADVAGSSMALTLQTVGQGAQAEDQIFDQDSIVLGETGKHRSLEHKF